MANCTNCGKPIKAGVKFCTSCGAPVTASEAEPAKTAAPKAETVKPTARQTSAAATTQPVMVGSSDVISTIGWIGYMILFAIPIIGLILYLVWAFGSGSNLNRRNYCRATLIMVVVALIIGIISGVSFYLRYKDVIDMLLG